MARVNRLIAVTAGTPVQLSAQPLIVDKLFIQMPVGSTGIGYVMDGIKPGVTADKTNAAHVTAELAPATATAPGGSYLDTSAEIGKGPAVDIQRVWIDCSVSGNMRVSCDTRV